MADQGANEDTRAPLTGGRGALRKMLRQVVLSLGALFTILTLFISAFVIVGVPIELGWLKGRVESAATNALGRDFAIDGPLVLVPSIPPMAQIESVRIANPEGWPDGRFVYLGLARAQLRILPLLRGEVLIQEIAVEGLDVNLETDASGTPNWLLELGKGKPAEESDAGALKFVELADLYLTGIRIQRHDAATGESIELTLGEVRGSAVESEPMKLRVRGSLEAHAYALELTAGPLADLVSGTKPWTLDLTAEMAGAKLSVRGELAEPLRGKGIAVDFDLAGPSMKDLEVLVGTKLPPIRTFDLRGHIEEVEGKYRLVDLAGKVAATRLTGSFEADLSKDKPILNGAMDIQRIDAWPVLAAIQEEQARLDDQAAAPDVEETQTSANETRTAEEIDLDAPFLTLDPLGKLDARFSLTVHEVANLATGLRNANLDIHVEDGKLSAPMSVILAGVPFTGELSLAPVDGQPQVAVTLGAERSTVGDLAKLLTGAQGIEGKFDSAQLEFQARGESIRNLIGSSELRFGLAGAALSYGHDQVGARSVELTLEEARMSFPTAAESRITAAGTLLGEPFSLEARGGTFIENFIDRSWPLQLTATGGGAQIDIDGTVRRAHLGRGSQIAFSLVGEPIGDLAAWVGVSPQATQSYELTGHVTRDLAGLRIQVDQARIGGSAFAGEIGNRRIGNTRETFAQLDFEVLDLAGLSSLLPEAQGERTPKQGKEALSIDAPILPKSIEFFDSDIDLSFARIRLKTTDITDARFSSKIEHGFLDEAPVELVLAGSGFEGKLGADFRGEVPAIHLRVASASVDIGALLAELGVAEGFELTAGGFDLRLALEGSSLRQLLERSSFSAAIEDGLWRITDANTQGILDVRIPKAEIEAPPGEQIALTLDGRIKRIPVKMQIKTDSVASFAEPKKRLRMEMDATMTNVDLNLIGIAPLPVQAKNLHFRLDLRGDRLSDFGGLLEVSLPPVGPYRLQGQFGTLRTGYYVKNLKAGVGRSTLSGKLDLNTLERPPRLAVDLAAHRIQLDDFELGEWSATEDAEPQAETLRDGKRQKRADENRPLLSPEVLHSLNAKISVRAQSVESGEDWLGSGNLVATLQDGRVAIEPLSLEIPGGSVDMELALRPGIGDFSLEAQARIEKLDYGILARRIDPESDAGTGTRHVFRLQGGLATGRLGWDRYPNDQQSSRGPFSVDFRQERAGGWQDCVQESLGRKNADAAIGGIMTNPSEGTISRRHVHRNAIKLAVNGTFCSWDGSRGAWQV